MNRTIKFLLKERGLKKCPHCEKFYNFLYLTSGLCWSCHDKELARIERAKNLVK